MAKKLIIVLRHGERSDEAPLHRQVEFSCDSDAPLTEIGLQQSELAALSIINLIPDSASVHLVSSPMIRCLQTASKLAEKLNLKIHIEEGFGECYQISYWDYDPYNNTHLKNDPDLISSKLGHIELIENQHIVRPKYTETEAELIIRINQVFPTYLEKTTEDVLVICTHNLPLKIITQMMGGDIEKFHSNYTLISSGYFENNGFSIVQEFDISHLPTELQKPFIHN